MTGVQTCALPISQSIENAVAQVLTQARTRDIYTEDSGCKLVGCQEMGSLTAGLI